MPAKSPPKHKGSTGRFKVQTAPIQPHPHDEPMIFNPKVPSAYFEAPSQPQGKGIKISQNWDSQISSFQTLPASNVSLSTVYSTPHAQTSASAHVLHGIPTLQTLSNQLPDSIYVWDSQPRRASVSEDLDSMIAAWSSYVLLPSRVYRKFMSLKT